MEDKIDYFCGRKKMFLMKRQKTVSYWQFVLLAHLSALLAFAIIRGIQIAYCSVALKDNTPFSEYLECFGRGLVYDNHCSLLALCAWCAEYHRKGVEIGI